MQEGPFPTFPAYNRHSSRKARAFLFVALFVLLLGVGIVAGNFFLSERKEGERKSVGVAIPTKAPTPQATSATSPTPTPTPEKELDKSELSVQALNGSGTSGAASDLAAVLKEAGYTVASTGNADNFEYEQTVVQIKKSQKQYADALVKDLSDTYAVSSQVETLSENAKTDAIVIVGAK